MSVAVPPGGRVAPGGEVPPGGESPPGGRGAPGGEASPTAPLGRPPRIKLVPLKKRGTGSVQKVKVQPDRVAQLRQALTPKQRQAQIHKHVQETMPQFKGTQQGPQAVPQQKGMGQKGQAHRATVHAKVQARRDELKAQKAKTEEEAHEAEMRDKLLQRHEETRAEREAQFAKMRATLEPDSTP